MGVLRSPSFRIGKIGNTCGKWDNGFYTEGYIHNLPLQMLIDNGSTCSILNHSIYLKLWTLPRKPSFFNLVLVSFLMLMEIPYSYTDASDKH
jgi:hypothetical protein